LIAVIALDPLVLRLATTASSALCNLAVEPLPTDDYAFALGWRPNNKDRKHIHTRANTDRRR
jgi:hypothetical protein